MDMTRARAKRTPWGKIKLLPSGRYWAAEPLGGGKYRPAPDTFTSRSAADKWLRTRELERDGEKAVIAAAKADGTFGYWLDLWMAKKAKAYNAGYMSPKGYAAVEQNTRNWVRPVKIGNRLLTDISIYKIDTPMIEAIQASLRSLVGPRGRTSPSQAHKAELNIYSVLKYAVEKNALAKNPFRADDVYVSNYDGRRDDFELTAEMVDEIANKVPLQYRAAIFLWAYTGLRAGEAWGIQLRDLNVLHSRVGISRQLVSTPEHLIRDPLTYALNTAREPADSIPFGSRIRTGVELRPPKPQRAKTLDVHGFVLAELKAHIERRQPEAPYDWLFLDHKGLPVNHGNFYGYVFKPVCRSLGIPDSVDVHTLRHFCGAYHLNLGYPSYVVQTMLDHSQAEMTRRYSHLMPGGAAKWHQLAEAEYAERIAK